MTALLLRGSATLNKGVSLRISVPAGMVVEAKQPSPSPGEARTVYTLSISRFCRDGCGATTGCFSIFGPR